ncbi:MAG: hypothetical protein ACK4IK_08850 [Bacteroidia bacterium]
MKKFVFLLTILIVAINPIYAQYKNVFAKQNDKKTYDESIIDPEYGIMMYEKLNPKTGGDSIRNNAGYAAQGWIEDYYDNGKLLHKGYYVEGQLKVYKNFYPDGTLEREFKSVGLSNGELTTFYRSGKLKTKSLCTETFVLKYEEYFENGQLEYLEEYDKKGEYYIRTQNYFENGKPESILELKDPKKLIYTKIEYYENGNIKENGAIYYSRSSGDYYKTDIWKEFDENGKLIKEITYENGKPISEKIY